MTAASRWIRRLFFLSGAFVQSDFSCLELAICVTIHIGRKANVGHMPSGESQESETSPNPSEDFEDPLGLIDDVTTTPNGFILIIALGSDQIQQSSD